MLRRIAVLLALACAACTSASGSSSGDAGAVGANGQPCSQYQLCVQSGDVFHCDCGGTTWSACPAGASSEQACAATFKGGCMGCSQGATFTCTCTDAGLVGLDGGTVWSCLGGGQACR